MTLRIRLIVLAVTILFLVVIAIMVRRRQLRARYLVVWTSLCVLALPVIAVPDILTRVSSALGIFYPPATLFFAATIILFGVNIQFSREISRLEERTRVLAEELSLERLERERGREEASSSSTAEEDASGSPASRGRLTSSGLRR